MRAQTLQTINYYIKRSHSEFGARQNEIKKRKSRVKRAIIYYSGIREMMKMLLRRVTNLTVDTCSDSRTLFRNRHKPTTTSTPPLPIIATHSADYDKPADYDNLGGFGRNVVGDECYLCTEWTLDEVQVSLVTGHDPNAIETCLPVCCHCNNKVVREHTGYMILTRSLARSLSLSLCARVCARPSAYL